VLKSHPVYVSALIAEMQKCPQFETWVRESNLDIVIPGLLPGFWYKRVIVHIKHTPDLIVSQVLILLAFRSIDGALFQLYSALTPPGRISNSMRLRSKIFISLKYPGSVRVPSQTIKNRGRISRKGRRRRRPSPLSRFAIAGLEAQEKRVRVDEWNRAVPAL
jgi:hypothetical protein